ncbi:MAG: agmatine deiminase family protein [Actinomycetes bacterium]
MNDLEAAGTTPRSAGYRMPAEWWPHECCLIAWPTVSRSYWGEYFLLAQATYAAVARAVARFEPVLVIANPGEGRNARSYCGSDNIEIVELPIDDSWIRDSGPNVLLGADGRRAVADFAFNSWGEKFLPYDKDAKITQLLCEHFGWERFVAPMILEGGAFSVDGEGTLITTESCLLHPSRNPDLSREKQEQILCDFLGVDRVVWLKAGRAEATDTDGHVDGVCHFVAPGRVILQMVHDPALRDFESFRENRRVLDEAVDEKGRSFEVLEMDRRTTFEIGGKCLAGAFYINSYQANGGLVVPVAGTAYDEHALERIREIFPDREVVGVPTPVLAYGGGGIHCITQQVPMSAPGPR